MSCSLCHKRGGRHQCIVCGNVYDTVEQTQKHQEERQHDLGGHAKAKGPLNRADRPRGRSRRFDDPDENDALNETDLGVPEDDESPNEADITFTETAR